MGPYSNLVCNKCNFSFTGGFTGRTAKGGLGLPYIECPQCKTLNHTGLQPYSQFSGDKKMYYWTTAFFRGILWALCFGFVPSLILFSLLKIDISKVSFILIPVPVILFCYQMYVYRKNITVVEDYYVRKDWTLKV